MENAIDAYNISDDWDADFTEDEQCMIVGYAWAHHLAIRTKSAMEYAMDLI